MKHTKTPKNPIINFVNNKTNLNNKNTINFIIINPLRNKKHQAIWKNSVICLENHQFH
ncbi:MAG: hypothetical protein ACJAXJ_003382 [Colwellia sp.]